MIGYFSEDELKQFGFKSLGTNVKISRTSTLYGCQNISIGNNVRIDNFVVIAISGSSKLEIGNHVQISAFSFINGSANIYINDFVTFSPYCRIFSSMDDYSGNFLTNATLPRNLINTISNEVVLEDHCILGVGTSIMPGVRLKRGVAVGAHSFVNNSFDEFSMIAGVPAKLIKKRSRKLLELEIQINPNND